MAKQEIKLIANNKKAHHDYFLEEKYEAGVELHGTEVKSLRMGKCSIKEAFVRIEINFHRDKRIALLCNLADKFADL